MAVDKVTTKTQSRAKKQVAAKENSDENIVKSDDEKLKADQSKKRGAKARRAKSEEPAPTVEPEPKKTSAKKRGEKATPDKMVSEEKPDSPKKARARKIPASKDEPVKKRDKKEPVEEPKAKPSRSKKTKETPEKDDKEVEEKEAPKKAPARGKKAPSKKEESVEKEQNEAKPQKATTARTKKIAVAKVAKSKEKEDDDDDEEEEEKEEATAKKSPKKKETKAKSSPKKKEVKAKAPASKSKKAAEKDSNEGGEEEAPVGRTGKKLQNSVLSNLDIDYDIKENYSLKIMSWNLSGVRSCVDKGCVEYIKREEADIICLNELKVGSEKEIPDDIKLEGYHAYWNIKKGEPGVAILSKEKPISVTYDLPEIFTDDKRLITAEYEDFYLVACYVVNAGRGLKTLDKRLEWNKVFDKYVLELDEKKPVIIAGDLNVAHTEIDLANPKSNQKNAGFTKEERDGFSDLLASGFVDTFRQKYPEQTGAYTFWSYMSNARAKNVGWRLDYFVVSERFMENVADNVIRSTIKGSDHCPIVLFLDI